MFIYTVNYIQTCKKKENIMRHWASTYISLRCATLRIHSFRHANASDRDRRQSLGLLQAGPKFFYAS